MLPSSGLRQQGGRLRARQEIVVFAKDQHRQFPAYKVFLHVFENETTLSNIVSSVGENLADSDGAQQLDPGHLVAVCIKGMEEHHSFHLLVFGLVDMDDIEQDFSTTRSKLKKQARALHLGTNEWALGTVLLEEGQTTVATSELPAASDDLIEFASDLAKLGDFVLGKSLISSVHIATSRLGASVKRQPTIGSPHKASYSAIVGTSLPGTTSQWSTETSDSTSVPCLSFEWSAYTMQDSIIRHILGYSITVSEAGVAVLLNRHFAVYRSQPISAIQLVPLASSAKQAQCGLLLRQGTIYRFSSLPRLNQNATHTEKQREIEALEKAVAIMKKRYPQGTAGDTERCIANLRESTTHLVQDSIDPASKLVNLFDGLAMHKDLPVAAIASKARSILANAATSDQNDKRAIGQLREALDLIIKLGQSASLILSGLLKKSDLQCQSLVDLFSSQEVAMLSALQDEEVVTPTTRRLSHVLPSSSSAARSKTDRKTKSVRSKRKRLSVDEDVDDESDSESDSRSSGDEEDDRRPAKKGSSTKRKRKGRNSSNGRWDEKSQDDVPRFSAWKFRQALQSAINQTSRADTASAFIERWSPRLIERAKADLLRVEIGLGEKPTTPDLLPCLPSDGLTKAAQAKHQVLVLQRQLRMAEHYERKQSVSQWLQIVAIHDTWIILNDLSSEIVRVYSKVRDNRLFAVIEVDELEKALRNENLEYSEPLIRVVMYLYERLTKVLGQDEDEGGRSEEIDGENLPDKLATPLRTELKPESTTIQSSTERASSSRHSCSPEPECDSTVNISLIGTLHREGQSRKHIFQTLVQETLLQIYYPEIVDCLATTNMKGEPLGGNMASITWISNKRWLKFRMQLITRLTSIKKPGATNGEIVGTDIFTISPVSQMVFAPGTVLPMPMSRADNRKFYDYATPYAFPDMLAKAASPEIAKEWGTSSEMGWGIVFRIIANASADIEQLAKKLKALINV